MFFERTESTNIVKIYFGGEIDSSPTGLEPSIFRSIRSIIAHDFPIAVSPCQVLYKGP